MRTWGQRHGLGKPKTQALTGDWGGRLGRLVMLIRPKKGGRLERRNDLGPLHFTTGLNLAWPIIPWTSIVIPSKWPKEVP